MAQTDRVSLWRHGGFRRLWAALTISRFGSAITRLALPLTAILLLDATPAQMGLLVSLEMLPYLVIGLPAGVWVDRFPRRLILVTADLVRALALLTVPFAALLNALTMEQLYLVGLVVGICTVFSDVSEEAVLPALIGRDHLVEGYSKLAASGSVVEIAGPGIAGVLVQILSAPLVILIDAVTYFISGLLIRSIRVTEAIQQDTSGGLAQFRVELVEGLRYALKHPLIRPMVSAAGTLNFFGGMFDALLILHLVENVGLSPALIGVLYMSGSVGGLLAAAFGERFVQRFGAGPVHIAAALMLGFGMLAISWVNGDFLLVAVIIALAWFVQGTGNTAFNVTYSSIVQGTTPDHLLGCVNASERVIGVGALPIGAFLGGLLATQFGLHPTLMLAGVGGFLAFLWVMLSPLRGIKQIA